MKVLTLAARVLAGCTLAFTANADSMRCGKWVVNESATPQEVLEKCGAPQSQSSSTEDVFARNANGSTRKIGTRVVERWFYQPGPGRLKMTVVIDDGRIKSIERATE